MNNTIKSATAIVVATSLVTTSINTTTAEAATYKIKSGKLVSAKTNKVVKGYKLYKNILYKDGKRKTGYALYKNVLYQNGKKKTATTVYKNILYVKGKKSTGYKRHKNILYYNAEKFTGTYGQKYYKKGKVFTGFRTINAQKVYFKSGVRLTGVYKNVFYVSGLPNVGQKVHKDILYKDSQVATGIIYFENKLYVNGKLANGTFELNGKLELFVNGILQNDVTSGTETGNNPNAESGNKPSVENGNNTNTSATEKISTINNTEVYKEVSASNIAQIQAIVDAYNQLSTEDKQKVTYPISEVAPLLTIYKLNESKLSTVNAQNLDEARELLKSYNDLSASNKSLVKLDVKSLEQEITKYLNSLKLTVEDLNKKETFSEVTSTNYEQAKNILEAYAQLSEAEKNQITYPITSLKQLVDVYKLNHSTLPTINASTIEAAKELVALYDALGANQSKVTFDIKALKRAIELYESPSLLTVETLNKNEEIKEVTASNLTKAQEIVNSFNKLSAADKLKVTYPVERLSSLIKVYEINLVTWKEVDEKSLKQTEDAITLYNQIDASDYSKVKINIDELKNAVAAYKFIKTNVSQDLSKYENAVVVVANYNALDSKVRELVKNKINIDTALKTIENTNLNNQITTLKSEISAYNVPNGVNDKSVINAKRTLQKALASSKDIQDAVANEVTLLKQNIATYDYHKYALEIIHPAKIKAIHASSKDAYQKVTVEEITYWARMFNESTYENRKEYLKSGSVSVYPNLGVLSAGALAPQPVIVGASLGIFKGSVSDYIDDKNYLVINLDKLNGTVDGSTIQYYFEETFKYTDSQKLLAKD